MSETLTKIKEMLSLARRAKMPTSFLSFVISECESVGKSKGNRESTESEVQAVIKKLIDTNNLALSHATKKDYCESISSEIKLLESLRPEMVNEDDLTAFITSLGDVHIGQVMGAVKGKFGTSADMKLAAKIFKELW